MAYTFDYLFAADPSNPQNIARNSSITIFAVGDAAKTPVALKTLDGQPYPNPVTTNANGFAPKPVHETLDQLAWAGGGMSGTMVSYEGMKAEAVDARTAAENAAAEAAAAAQAELEARIEAGNFKGEKGADGSNVLPTDDAIEAAITGAGTKTKAALSATYASYVSLAKNPDLLITGDVTRVDGVVTAAAVVWPDGSPGTFTPTYDSSGAVASYTITYGSPATKTFTQPTITRDASGAATSIPQIVVS
jgi:hypothetical protein